MGSTAESSDCTPNENGIIEFSKQKSCKMRCLAENQTTWLAPKKPFKCVCDDHGDNNKDGIPDGRKCQWVNLALCKPGDSKCKAFDGRFWKNQQTDNPNVRCSP